MTTRVRRRTPRGRIGDEMTPEARAAMVRAQDITRERLSLLRDPSPAAERRLHTLALETADQLAIRHDDWLRRWRQ